MAWFIVRRLLSGLLLVVAVTAMAFALIFASGTNIAVNILGPEASPEAAAALSARLGLDRPLVEQYVSWIVSALRGDLGVSYFSPETVSGAIAIRMPVTVSVVAVSLAATAVFGVVIGVASARGGAVIDKIVQFVAVLGFALPSFWIALMLVLLVAVPLNGLLPSTGYVPPSTSISAWVASITLPSVALTIGGVATISQQIRGEMLATLRLDFVRTLRARGLSERSIVYRHALRNSAGPALTVLSMQFIGMLGGAVIIERVFALPGIGTLATSASLRGDIPMVMGVVAMTVVLVVVINLVTDILQGVLNPKARVIA